MRHSWIRRLANVVVFAGWVFPLLLARFVPPPTAADAPDAARMFTFVGGGWAFLAVCYGLVLALRLRRTIM